MLVVGGTVNRVVKIPVYKWNSSARPFPPPLTSSACIIIQDLMSHDVMGRDTEAQRGNSSSVRATRQVSESGHDPRHAGAKWSVTWEEWEEGWEGHSQVQ